MTFFPTTITVVANSAKDGKCRHCGKRIAWVTVVRDKGKPARMMPFDKPTPWPLNVVRNDETRVALEVWPRTALHFTTCSTPKEMR